MDTGEKVILGVMAVIFLAWGIFLGYESGHSSGFNHGVTIQQLYYQENGKFLSEDNVGYWQSHHWNIETENISEYWRP